MSLMGQTELGYINYLYVHYVRTLIHFSFSKIVNIQ